MQSQLVQSLDNTMNVSESMLTYRKEEHESPLAAGDWSWMMTKAEVR
ncbi:hypothetical protein [Bacillus sp. FJAT-52991]|uniref:Uncharacterized protein n=1 Tax=Bacillus kandeliae TaxID=3129297 RepID=A0ABZ2N983_9BACI